MNRSFKHRWATILLKSFFYTPIIHYLEHSMIGREEDGSGLGHLGSVAEAKTSQEVEDSRDLKMSTSITKEAN